MKRMGLWLAISGLSCLSIYTTTVAIEQTITARNTRFLLDQLLTAQTVQLASTPGWWI